MSAALDKLPFLDVEQTDSAGSKFNLPKDSGVVKLARLLLDYKAFRGTEITVITFYFAQTQAIQDELLFSDRLDDVEVHSVDSMQGRENDCIILSGVRTGCHARHHDRPRRINH